MTRKTARSGTTSRTARRAAAAKTSNPPKMPDRKPRPCPICKAMSVPRYHPFCSQRCADIDLHRWFSGRYAVPAVEPPDEAGQAEAAGKAKGKGRDGEGGNG